MPPQLLFAYFKYPIGVLAYTSVPLIFTIFSAWSPMCVKIVPSNFLRKELLSVNQTVLLRSVPTDRMLFEPIWEFVVLYVVQFTPSNFDSPAGVATQTMFCPSIAMSLIVFDGIPEFDVL